MFLSALIDVVQDELEDPGGFATFNDTVTAQAAENACRYLGNVIGRNEGRLALDMVADQADYPLPTSVDLRRIEKVRILPETGGEPPRQGIIQIDLVDLPITDTTQSGRDPDRFVLNLTGGTNEDRYTLTLWPTPNRSGRLWSKSECRRVHPEASA